MNYPDNDYEVLFKPKQDPERKIKKSLFLIGIFLTPITLGGALWGYIRAYYRKLQDEDLPPSLEPLHPFARKAMFVFAAVTWLIILGAALIFFIAVMSGGDYGGPSLLYQILVFYLIPNSIITFLVMRNFNIWRGKIYAMRSKANMFGSAKWADKKDFSEYVGGKGIYIGAGYVYSKMGHLISVAGTRSGKATNLIFPNLLGASDYDGSWLVIDPKGEGASVTASYQKSIGNDVQVLDPWGVVNGQTTATFNPLDIFSANDTESLIDDATMMANMIVPENKSGKDPYWDDRARSIIAAMIAFCIEAANNDLEIYAKYSDFHSLTNVWRFLRLSEDDFADLLFDMTQSNVEFISLIANEIVSLKINAGNTFGAVMSTAQSHTDFLKSPALQKSIEKSSFEVKNLSKKKTTLYVVIPPDRLASQGKWLRLVVSSALRAVIRNKGHRVTFVLDEFAAIGNLGPDISSFMAVGAGYNITLWPIFQTISQLQEIYDKSWQTFLGNAAVKHFFGIGDNATAKYVSDMIGGSTYVVYDKNIIGEDKSDPKQRMLATPDEVRRGSSDNIFTFVDQKPAGMVQKWNYWDMDKLKGRYDKNPMYVNSVDAK